MATSLNIRHRLLTVVLLGVVTSAVSLLVLVRALSSVSRQVRVERARDALTDEVHRLALSPVGPAAQRSTLVGVRGGWLDGPSLPALPGVPEAWRAPLGEAAAASASRTARVVTETALASGTLVLAVEPAPSGLAWAGYHVPPSSYLRPWWSMVMVLAAATALLVATAAFGAVSLRRSTAALDASLRALGKDLTAPVPTPRVAELDGIADGIRRMARELNDSREATERLQRELGQKERLAALGRVAAGVAHEVRNPLASIKLRLDLALASAELAEAARRSIGAASDEIARLDRLVGDLLLVAGKKMGPRVPVEIGTLVRARAESLQPWAAARRVTVRADGAGSAEVDAESLSRAVDNLLRNAVEASPDGGTVEARVVAREAAVEVAVEDRGRGVEAARVAELFEPFFTTKSDGTGLGLAISRAIARAHGGDLAYQRRDEVTRFSLSLPAKAHA